jgi:hypothetical protein
MRVSRIDPWFRGLDSEWLKEWFRHAILDVKMSAGF